MLSTIENLLHDHEALRGHMQILRRSVDELREILNPEGSADNLTHYQRITKKRCSFNQIMGHLKGGLRSLHSYEEESIQTVEDTLSLQSIKSADTPNNNEKI